MSASSDRWRERIKHAGATVCLRFAPLEISMRALCVLQRDDKLKRGIQSRAVQRTKRYTGDSGCFSTTQSPHQSRDSWSVWAGEQKKRKEKKEKYERGGPFVVTPVCELC